jgi:2-C-methyl-D-erythritol 4-phosphate cytidylyltransferase
VTTTNIPSPAGNHSATAGSQLVSAANLLATEGSLLASAASPLPTEGSLFSLIVAGGLGTRMGANIPKQFLLLAGKPVLMHSIEAFRLAIPSIKILVVLPEGQEEIWAELCDKHHFCEPHDLVTGGNTRYQSVKNGLAQWNEKGWVAIHDGVRPLISCETISRLFAEAAVHSNAIPVIAPKDSMRWCDEHGSKVINRNFVKLIQTPQVFELNKLKASYVQEYEDGFTDDATVWEKAGNQIHLAEGQESNIKITRPEDLVIAEALLTKSLNSIF